MKDVSKNKLDKIIRIYKGHSYRTAGMLFGFFPDALAAKAAASVIASAGVSVVVCGSQIIITI